jgi:hypothetical protein
MDAVIGVCAQCRRPNDEGEIERGLALARDSKLAVRMPVARVVRWAVFLALCAGLYTKRDLAKKLVVGWGRQFGDAMDKAAGPGVPATPEAAGGAPATAALGGASPVSGPVASTSTVYVPPAEAPLGMNDWGLSGRLFNLKTLDPMPRVRMFFISAQGDSRTALTDDHGAFQVALPKGTPDGLAIRVQEPSYVPWLLCEHDIPYGRLTTEDRKQLIGIAIDGDAPPSRVVEPVVGTRSQLDVFAAPR